MTLTIYPSQAYALLAGLFIGKFTNLFSDVVITGLVLYIVTPEIFTEDRLERGKRYFWSWFSPRTDRLDRLENSTKSNEFNLTSEQTKILMENQSMFDFSKLPKIEVLSSPIPQVIKTTN